MRRPLTAIALAVATATVLTTSQAGAAGVRTEGEGWKAAEIVGITSVSPVRTYTVTFRTEAIRERYAPYLGTAVRQLAAVGLRLRIGGVEPGDPRRCGPAYHIQFTEMYRPTGTPGWSQGAPCPHQPRGLGRGGLVAIDSEYFDGTYHIEPHVLANTVTHELLHALGLDHPNRDLDGDGTAAAYECVTTSAGVRPLMCSPNGGYRAAEAGRLTPFDLARVEALLANARTRGIG